MLTDVSRHEYAKADTAIIATKNFERLKDSLLLDNIIVDKLFL